MKLLGDYDSKGKGRLHRGYSTIQTINHTYIWCVVVETSWTKQYPLYHCRTIYVSIIRMFIHSSVFSSVCFSPISSKLIHLTTSLADVFHTISKCMNGCLFLAGRLNVTFSARIRPWFVSSKLMTGIRPL